MKLQTHRNCTLTCLSTCVVGGIGVLCVAIFVSNTASTAHAAGVVGAGTAAIRADEVAKATITVNDTSDNTTAGDGKCTLREAIANVNAAADTTGGDCAAGTGKGDTVVFDLTLPATITLTANSELAISRDVTISGPTAGALAVDGNHATRVFDITAGTTSISNLTVQNGRSYASQSGYEGGGLYIAQGGAATLTNCAVSGNSAYYPGGGIANSGTVTLTNCTLSGNSGGYGGGGGLYSEGTATLTNCTVSSNSAEFGDGIEGSAMLINTIVANNSREDNTGEDCCGAVISLGHNLDSDGTCGFTAAGDLSNTDPKLGPLQDNGGPTFTQALQPGSPAIDAGDDAVTGPPLSLTIDQRGRPRKTGLHVDVGAYEADAPQAPSFTVNSTADAPDANPGDGVCASAEGSCTLGAAIDEASAGAGGNVINVPAGTYPGGLDISVSLTLSGAGATATRIDGGGPVVHVGSGVVVDIHDVAIQNGARDGGSAAAGFANEGDVILTNVTITDNANVSQGSEPAIGGGFSNSANATLINVTIRDNRVITYHGNPAWGGGIFNDTGGVLTLTNSTLSGNSSENGYPDYSVGGGIYNEGNATLTNVTISGNTALDGGGIANTGSTTLTHVTISANTAGDPGGSGIYSTGGTVLLKDTIVANPGTNCAGTLVSQGYNISSDATCAFTYPSDLSNTDPKLGPLQDNGGPTFTQALLPGSPAIDAEYCPPPTTDQRGVRRPQGAACDIGAYEFRPIACFGDCNQNNEVTIDEISTLVDIALGNANVSACPELAAHQVSTVTIAQIIQAVNNALNGCT